MTTVCQSKGSVYPVTSPDNRQCVAAGDRFAPCAEASRHQRYEQRPRETQRKGGAVGRRPPLPGFRRRRRPALQNTFDDLVHDEHRERNRVGERILHRGRC